MYRRIKNEKGMKIMSFYEQIVNEVQMSNYSRYYNVYASGRTVVPLTKKEPLPYEEQIQDFVQKVKDADYVIVGGASGLSAAGGGDFYYEDNASYRKYFGKYAEKYGFKGAFAGAFAHWDSREEFWGYMATCLHTTQHAEVRKPYLDLDAVLADKEFFVLTTNQDTQFVKLYPESKVAQIQGDHRFFQCSRCCTDEVWDAVKPVQEMIDAMGEGTEVPKELIPRCPHCGAEAFPWVRGYGNFLTGKILFLELGVGRLTPMFIQEPFWALVNSLPQTTYISVNKDYAFLPEAIEDRGLAIQADIGKVLEDVRSEMEKKVTAV